MVHKFVWTILLLVQTLAAVDINATLVNANKNFYEKMLKEMGAASNKSEELTIQKTLLYKLINLSNGSTMALKALNLPEDTASFRELFSIFLELSQSTAALKKEYDEIQQSKKMLKKQLDLGSKKEPSVLSWQLQYAYYAQSEKVYEKKINESIKKLESFPKLFAAAIRRLSFDKQTIKAEQDRVSLEIQNNELAIQKYRLNKERLNLIANSHETIKIDHTLERLMTKQQGLIKAKLEWDFQLFCFELKNKKDEAFVLAATIPQSFHGLDAFPQLSVDLTLLLHTLLKEILGTAVTIKGAMLEEMKQILGNVWKRMNEPFFSINETPINLLKIIIALFVFVVSFYLGSYYKKSVHTYTKKRKSLEASTRTILANLGYYIIIIASFFIALNILGIDLSSIALIAGALSVGIGFGLQNVVANFVSGLILMFERSIKVGDYIQLTAELRGHVSDIRMRSTTINTNSNIDVIVPNQDLIQKQVINWTMSDDIRRFDIPFSVAYGTSIETVIEVVLEALHGSGFDDIYESSKYQSRVVMVAMNQSSIDLELLVWIKGDNILYPKRTMSRFLMMVYNVLNKHGIQIPFPQRDLHLKSINSEVSLHLEKTLSKVEPNHE